jgi:hypothetical protein
VTIDQAATVQAIAAVISAMLVGAAVFVAWQSRTVASASNKIASKALEIASDARDAEAAQAELADEAIRQTRRLSILSTAPSLFAWAPSLGPNPPRFSVAVTNSGPGAAYGVIATVAGSSMRSIETAVDATKSWSGRIPAVPPDTPERLQVDVSKLISPDREWTYPWLVVQIDYFSQLGAHVRLTYIWSTIEEKAALWRLHRVTLDPRDGGPTATFDLSLGPDADPPPSGPFSGVA